jgi:c-di-GMP-binding flagellar brake protein YcgR
MVAAQEAFLDRRRHPRVPLLGSAPVMSLPTALTVQLLDISETGVLLSSSQRLTVGQRAQLRTRIGSEPMTLNVEVRRVSDATRHSRGPFRVGAQFVGLDDETQRKISRFLSSNI